MSSYQPQIHVALPAMNEFGFIEHTLECLHKQTLQGFHTWICVNQPENHRYDPEKKHIVENNALTLKYLAENPFPGLHVIDCSSHGRGWQGKNLGVGMARKTLMDAIVEQAQDRDIIVSLDADTLFGENYLQSVLDQFKKNPCAMGLANPYFHPLGYDTELNRAILRYEIYMRYYALNMRFAGTPWCFTPLGSAMAAPVWACKKVNGLTPKKSGEDFYFLLKLAKAGHLLMYNPEIVYPATRLSNRVFFGTGPALIKGVQGQWTSYPLFSPFLFEKVKETIDLFPQLHTQKVPTPMDDFLNKLSGCEDLFEPLRQNHKTTAGFVKACHEKIDGLRILQFLKLNHDTEKENDEQNLQYFLRKHFNVRSIETELDMLNFNHSSIVCIDKIRIFLFETELKFQQKNA